MTPRCLPSVGLCPDGGDGFITRTARRTRKIELLEQLMTSQPDTVISGRQWLAGIGLVYGILFGVAAVATNQGPGINASATAVAHYYNSHHGSSELGIFLVLAGCVALAFFSGVLRNAVFPSLVHDRGLMTVSALGTAVWISGMLLMAALQTTLLDASRYGHASVIQSVNYLAADDFFPVVIGICIFAVATGIGILRSRALPAWLGWVTVALGVLAAAGPLGGIAFLAAPVWAVVTGVVMLLLKRPSPATVLHQETPLTV
jgi:hypothetical protein